MKHSFRTKVVAVFLISVLLCMLFLDLLCGVFLRYIFIYDSKNAMVSYARQIETDMKNGSRNIDTILRDMNDSYAITASAVDEDANVFFSYRHFIDEEIKADYLSWIKNYKNTEFSDNEHNYYFEETMGTMGAVEKIIFVGKTGDGIYILMTKEIKGIDQDIRVTTLLLLVMSVIIVAIGTVVWGLCTRPFTSQVEKMSRITDKMARLNFEEKINYNSSDEIGVLAKSIDSMSDELKSSIKNLKEDIEKRKCTLRDLSHEIKTPITTIRGYTENIQYVCGDDARVQKYCNIMLDECDEIIALINEMLMMSQLESDEYIQQWEIVSAARLSHELRIRIENEFAENEIGVEMETAKFSCNAGLVQRALMNFVSNAVKYGNKGTPITVKGAVENDRYVFAVTNEGAEISEEDSKFLWEAFYKSDKSRKRGEGHGIGLSIVNRIAKTHGGGVDIKSENGRNTFIMWIPII